MEAISKQWNDAKSRKKNMGKDAKLEDGDSITGSI